MPEWTKDTRKRLKWDRDRYPHLQWATVQQSDLAAALKEIERLEIKTEAALFIAGTKIADEERVRLMVQALSAEGKKE